MNCRLRRRRTRWLQRATRCNNAKALSDQAAVELGYSKVFAPVTGKVNQWAARQGEVVNAGTPIVTIMDLTQTWVYAPLPETQADAVQLGDTLNVVMPSGATVQGKVIAKSAEADFATQRDINGGRKRDIKTVRLKLLIDNPGERFVPGMTADVYIPKAQAGEAMRRLRKQRSSNAGEPRSAGQGRGRRSRWRTSSSGTAISKR